MLRLAVVCAVLALVIGQEEPHCCAPDVWEGELHAAAGYVTTGSFNPKYVHQRDFVIYDYTAKMSSYSHHTYYEDGTERSFRMLMHWNTKKGYFIEENECNVFNLTREMRRMCAPGESHLLPVYYGMGEHVLHGYRYYERHIRDGVDVGATTTTVTQHGCVPIETVEFVEEASHGPVATVDVVSGGTYANIVLEVTDREMLEPPTYCVEGRMPKELEHISNFQIFLNQHTK